MEKIYTLNPSNAKDNKNLDNFWTLDCETWGLSPKPENLAFGVLYNPKETFLFTTKQQFKQILKQKKFRSTKIFAHNAEFDLSAIFGNIFKNLDSEAVFNGSRFIYAKLGSISFYDSVNLLPFTLAKIGEQLGFKKFETPEKFFKTENKYRCSIDLKDIEYCKQDCAVLWKALRNFFEVTGVIKMTIGSMAMNYFRRNFLTKPIRYNENNFKFFESYYGGRTEAFKLGECNANVIDINSLYPYVMTETHFPDPSKLKQGKNMNTDFFKRILKYNEGLVHCVVLHPDFDLGMLPYKKDNKLIFPVGSFAGWFNFNELRNALQYDLKILKVLEYYYASPMETPFKDFINFTYDKRLENAENFMQLVYKLLMNNLYGKFAQRKKYKKEYFEVPPFKEIERLFQENKFFDIQSLGLDREDVFLITENLKLEKSYSAIPSFASYITSSARSYLLGSIMENYKLLDVLYCDTDSIFYEGDISRTSIKLGKDLGQWKIEDKQVCEIRGLKNYSIRVGEGVIDKIKGVPARALFENGVYKYETYTKTFAGLRNILGNETGDKITVSKRITGKYDKREIIKNGITKPIKLNEA